MIAIAALILLFIGALVLVLSSGLPPANPVPAWPGYLLLAVGFGLQLFAAAT